jgi:hypothetical protein
MTPSTNTRDEAFVVDPCSLPADGHIDEGTWSRAIREGVRLPLARWNRWDPMATSFVPDGCTLLVISSRP